MADDRLSAALEPIRSRGYENGAHGARAAYLSDAAAVDVPRLLAALDAALEYHQSHQRYQMVTGTPGQPCGHDEDYDGDAHFEADDGYWYCKDKPTVRVCTTCTHDGQWVEWPCPTYEDITSALLREGDAAPADPPRPEPFRRPEGCICPMFGDTGGVRIADLTCPVHGVGGTEPGDGNWEVNTGG